MPSPAQSAHLQVPVRDDRRQGRAHPDRHVRLNLSTRSTWLSRAACAFSPLCAPLTQERQHVRAAAQLHEARLVLPAADALRSGLRRRRHCTCTVLVHSAPRAQLCMCRNAVVLRLIDCICAAFRADSSCPCNTSSACLLHTCAYCTRILQTPSENSKLFPSTFHSTRARVSSVSLSIYSVIYVAIFSFSSFIDFHHVRISSGARATRFVLPAMKLIYE